MLKLTATSYQRRLGLYGLMQWQVMPLTHSIQIARSERSGGSLIPLTRFHPTERPSLDRPTPDDQLQTV